MSFKYSYSPKKEHSISNVVAAVDTDIEVQAPPPQRQAASAPRDVNDLSNDYYPRRRKEEELDEADAANAVYGPEAESTDDDDTTDDSSSGIKKAGGDSTMAFSKPCSRYFTLSIASNFLFVMASCFYLALAGNELDYATSIRDLSDDVINADDDYTWTVEAPFVGDDYVFSTKSGVWVSHYQMLYFAGAMCFVWSGLLDVIKEPGWLGVVLVLAGCFGLTSAMQVEKNEHMSNVFNCVSVHLFLVEAVGLFFARGAAGAMFANNRQLQTYVRLGDAFWIIGTLVDVVLSYYYVFGTDSLIHAQMAVFAATLWLACSLIYITATSHVECQGRKQYKLEMTQRQQQDNKNKSSLQENPTTSAETPSPQQGDGFNYMYDGDKA